MNTSSFLPASPPKSPTDVTSFLDLSHSAGFPRSAHLASISSSTGSSLAIPPPVSPDDVSSNSSSDIGDSDFPFTNLAPSVYSSSAHNGSSSTRRPSFQAESVLRRPQHQQQQQQQQLSPRLAALSPTNSHPGTSTTQFDLSRWYGSSSKSYAPDKSLSSAWSLWNTDSAPISSHQSHPVTQFSNAFSPPNITHLQSQQPQPQYTRSISFSADGKPNFFHQHSRGVTTGNFHPPVVHESAEENLQRNNAVFLEDDDEITPDLSSTSNFLRRTPRSLSTATYDLGDSSRRRLSNNGSMEPNSSVNVWASPSVGMTTRRFSLDMAYSLPSSSSSNRPSVSNAINNSRQEMLHGNYNSNEVNDNAFDYNSFSTSQSQMGFSLLSSTTNPSSYLISAGTSANSSFGTPISADSTMFTSPADSNANYRRLMKDVDPYFLPHDEASIANHNLFTGLVFDPNSLQLDTQFNSNYPSYPNTHKLYFVAFKGGRLDVFFIPDGAGLIAKKGDLVIVDADRGRDLGKVTHENVSSEIARRLKQLQHQQQQAALQQNQQNLDTPTRADGAVLQPKQIIRFAQPMEINQLFVKRLDEEKAMKVCMSKVEERGLNMIVQDAEYQWDRRKLTFFYTATHRIDFRDLVRDLFRVYKTRIWMCAICM
ncbi:PSP1 C-terminal conserved region-domain-containing protein [Lipomyces japonicus]|uniref:PSP1 C-terminal conserved region-domain-containing protein n=1 Tax=Lipomyces japonicus TaxID=56871 RepID=UPI0034CDE113